MPYRKELLLLLVLPFAAIYGFIELRNHAGKTLRYGISGESVINTGNSGDHKLTPNWGISKINAGSTIPRKANQNIVVAVIDTGCDIHHPELAKHLWRNPGESGWDEEGHRKESNGIDDDDNGFVDDLFGWNFAEQTNDVSDEHGHGTHVAGIIGAELTDGFGGVAPGVSLMILKYYQPENGSDNLRNTIASIRYAVQMGADIINYSGGGNSKSLEEEAVLRWASEQNVLVIAAAGNNGANSDNAPYFPADYLLPNIISVAAIDQSGQLLRSSNYGIKSVHIAAPGKNIYSTLPNGQHGYMTGTSQATAFVTGVAALIMSQERKTPVDTINIMIRNVSPRLSLAGKIRAGGILDAKQALESLKQVPLQGSGFGAIAN